MKNFIMGIILGILMGLLPLFTPETAYSIYPEWEGSFEHPEKIQLSKNPELKTKKYFPLKRNNKIYFVSLNGKIIQPKTFSEDELFVLSGNGKYFIKYQKLGKELEFFNINGERFWRYPTKTYPYLSYNAKIILLLIADLSKIFILDINSNKIGEESISGRFCTNIVFSKKNDFAALGFLDGSYYLINENGKIIINGEIPDKKMVKSINISNNGKYLVVHYGDTNRDGILILNTLSRKKRFINLPEKHITKTAVHITDNGIASIINKSRFFVINLDSEKIISVLLDKQKDGHASIDFKNKIYTISYCRKNGGSDFKIISEKGRVIYSHVYPEEPFLDTRIKDKTILVRGMNNLYCWSFDLAAD